ncbi:MAG: hypothetical protein QUV10_12525 [Paracoccaceae bacterium]|nr:hypothetical protein [Paracoccaceae bacterium]
MLVFAAAYLVLFAVPKTGSTAYHLALRSKADIVLAGKASIKHLTLRKYERHFAPYLEQAHGLVPERVAVIRDPLDYLRSWYRYRQRPDGPADSKRVRDMGFDAFVLATLERRPPPFAKIGTQRAFVAGRDGQIRVEHLFAYERPIALRGFLSERLGFAVKPAQKNVSPPAETVISAAVEAEFRQAMAADVALHQRIMAAGGHLVTPSGAVVDEAG